MSSDVLNTVILTVVMALAVGVGYFVTQKQQKAELDELVEQEEAIRRSQTEVETLLVEEATSAEAARDAVARWKARYKILPATLTSPEVVNYLNALSASGFKSFDITLGGVSQSEGFSIYSYNVTGEAYFESLYGFVWNVENGRGMYRIRDLQLAKAVVSRPNAETGVDRQEVLARFTMTVDAYFAGAEGMTASDSVVTVPAEVFPPRRPAVNLIYPHILDNLPPNTDDLVDVEADSLVSVIGGTAVFMRNGAMRSLRAGDRVYLGSIGSVHAGEGRVVANLNKGGIRERVELDLQTGERYRQALGSVRLDGGAAGPTLATPPPAPGTPEARARGLYQPATIDGGGSR